MTSRKKKRSKSTKGDGYLPFLRGPAIKSEGEAGTVWYACMADGLKALNAELDAKRDLLVAILSEPERAKTQIIEMLSAAPLPSPTAASSTS